MRAMLIIAATAMSLLGFGASQAWAAPGNDNFTAAQQLSGTSGDVASTSQGATLETGEPTHAGVVGGSSVWFRWTADRTGGLTILTRQISFDTVLAVYTGPSVDALTEIASNDNFGSGSASRVSFAAVPGTTYFVAVDGAGGAEGSFSLRWRQGPENDAFVDAEMLEGENGTTRGTVFGATAEPGEPLHGGAATVWYRWTAPEGATFALFLEGAQSVSVNTGVSVGALTTLATGTSLVTFPAVSGTEYTIAVEGGWSGSGFSLTWGPAPPNDDFADAALIEGSKGRVEGSTLFATVEPDESGVTCCGSTVWYSWTPEATDVRLEIADANFDTIMAVFRGTSLANLALVRSNDDFFGLRSALSFRATAGTTYFVAVSGFDQEWGNFALRWFPGAIIFGSNRANELNGTPGRDYIVGRGGSDVVHGRGGGDVIIGSDGADRLYGDGGADRLDSRDGVRGNDVLFGGPGSDSARRDRRDRMVSVP